MGLDFALVVILCLSSLTVIENTKSNPTHLPHQQNGRQWYIPAYRPWYHSFVIHKHDVRQCNSLNAVRCNYFSKFKDEGKSVVL